jgi:biopolymer transport protein ExbD
VNKGSQMQFSTQQKRKVNINITSLIDVLFLLLIFLMVSSTFLEQPGIKLELPEAKSAILMEQKDFTLFVDKDENLFLDEKGITLDNLEEKLKEVLPNMKDATLILKADRVVSHGLVVKVMDIAKKSGIKKLIVGTKIN